MSQNPDNANPSAGNGSHDGSHIPSAPPAASVVFLTHERDHDTAKFEGQNWTHTHTTHPTNNAKKNVIESTQAEFGRQINVIKEEWKGILSNVNQAKPPDGLSQADLTEWKKEQGRKAQERLKELEQRLNRLQMLSGKLSQMRQSSAQGQVKWATGGQAKEQQVLSSEQTASPSSHKHIGLEDYSEEVPSGDNVQGISTHARYLRPVSPGMVREIIKEEMYEALHPRRRDHDKGPGASADSLEYHEPEPAGLEHAKSAETRAEGEEDVDTSFDPNTSQETVRSSTELKSLHKKKSSFWKNMSTKKAKMFQKTKLLEVNSLEEAVPISCRLFFGGFSRNNFIRKRCFEIHTSAVWSIFFLIATFTVTIYIAILPELQKATSLQASASVELGEGPARVVRWYDVFDFLSASVLFFEVLTGIIALGFCGGSNTWFETTHFHKLDLIVSIEVIAEYVATFVYGLSGVTMRPFRMLRAFRAITRVRAFSGVRNIVISLSLGALFSVFSVLYVCVYVHT
jgi:hypothetical protein